MPASFFNLGTNLAAEPTFIDRLLTPQECADIIAAGERDLPLAAGRTENHAVNENLRRSDIGWLSPDGAQRWLFERVKECVNAVNGSWFGYKLLGFEGLQFTKYSYIAGQSDFYSTHVDTTILPGGTVRKLSFTIQLSGQTDYDGGDVVLYRSLTDTITLGKSVGSITLFPSYTIHEVMPVTRGVRYSLVGWASGPPFV